MDFGKTLLIFGAGFVVGVYYSSKVHDKRTDDVYSKLKEDATDLFESASDKLAEGIEFVGEKVKNGIDSIKQPEEQYVEIIDN